MKSCYAIGTPLRLITAVLGLQTKGCHVVKHLTVDDLYVIAGGIICVLANMYIDIFLYMPILVVTGRIFIILAYNICRLSLRDCADDAVF